MLSGEFDLLAAPHSAGPAVLECVEFVTYSFWWHLLTAKSQTGVSVEWLCCRHRQGSKASGQRPYYHGREIQC